MWTTRAASVALLAVALTCACARADEPPKSTPAPDPGFLEFLGGVDGLADVNPDYLKQAGAAHPGTAPALPPLNPPSPPPAAPPGAKNDE